MKKALIICITAIICVFGILLAAAGSVDGFIYMMQHPGEKIWQPTVGFFEELFESPDSQNAFAKTESSIYQLPDEALTIVPETEKKPRKSQWTIVLDPGHGGRDSGAVMQGGKKLKESDVNLAIARALKAELEKLDGVTVLLTHEELAKDEMMPLIDRVLFAKKNNADILLSIHNNANYADYSGAEIYITDSIGSGLRDDSLELASELMDAFGQVGMHRRGIFARRSQCGEVTVAGEVGDYYGIIRTGTRLGMISMLVENGFMNSTDTAFTTGEGLHALAKAQSLAIARFIGLEEASDSPDASGDLSGDGIVNEDDIAKAKAVLMCEFDAVTGSAYDAGDLDGDRLIDSADLLGLSMLSNNKREISFVQSGEADKVSLEITSDALLPRKNGVIEINVTLTGNLPIGAFNGTLDFSSLDFEAATLGTLPEGMTASFDEGFSLVRFCYLAGEEAQEEKITLTVKLKAKKKLTNENFSINANIYSAAVCSGDDKIAETSRFGATLLLGTPSIISPSDAEVALLSSSDM